MSNYERNRGLLIPLIGDLKTLVDEIVKEVPSWAESKMDAFIDGPSVYGYQELADFYYEVRGHLVEDLQGTHEDKVAIKLNNNGSIEFDTTHWNGGAHWMEMVEKGLEDNSF